MRTLKNMKKISILLVLFVSIISFKSNAQDKFTTWPALGEFHTVMAATFHPAEKGDFDPVKQRSGELSDKANALAKSIVPSQFDKPAIKVALIDLKTKSAQLNKLILKKAKEEKINTALTAVHDSFHNIVGLCTDEKSSH
jgi:hypothetical protein